MRTLSIPNVRFKVEEYVTASGKEKSRWYVRLGKKFTGTKAHRTRHKSYEAARDYVLAEVERKKAGGAAAFTLTPAQVEQASHAFALLDGRATISEAVQYFVRVKFPQAGTKTITQAAEAFLAEKTEEKCSVDYLKKIARVFVQLAAQFPAEKNINDVTDAELLAAFRRFRAKKTGAQLSGATWNHRRADCCTLWSWCIKKRYAATNPAQALPEKPTEAKDIEVLSPHEALAVLTTAKDYMNGQFLGFFILSIYAGLRTAEIARMTWDDVILSDPDEPRVRVRSGKAKDKEARIIDLPANAVAWLALVPFKNGQILPKGGAGTDRKNLAAIRKQAVGAWPHNGGRHSFVSYKSRRNGEAIASEEAGHESARITRKHYKGLVSKREAEAVFAITPDTTHAELAKMLTPQQPSPRTAPVTTAEATA